MHLQAGENSLDPLMWIYTVFETHYIQVNRTLVKGAYKKKKTFLFICCGYSKEPSQ